MLVALLAAWLLWKYRALVLSGSSHATEDDAAVYPMDISFDAQAASLDGTGEGAEDIDEEYEGVEDDSYSEQNYNELDNHDNDDDNDEDDDEDEERLTNYDGQISDPPDSTGHELFEYYDDEGPSAAPFSDKEIDLALFADEAVPLSSDESESVQTLDGQGNGREHDPLGTARAQLGGQRDGGQEDEGYAGSWNSVFAGESSSEDTEEDFSAFVRKAWGDRVDELAGATTPTTPPAAANHPSGPHNTVA